MTLFVPSNQKLLNLYLSIVIIISDRKTIVIQFYSYLLKILPCLMVKRTLYIESCFYFSIANFFFVFGVLNNLFEYILSLSSIDNLLEVCIRGFYLSSNWAGSSSNLL